MRAKLSGHGDRRLGSGTRWQQRQPNEEGAERVSFVAGRALSASGCKSEQAMVKMGIPVFSCSRFLLGLVDSGVCNVAVSLTILCHYNSSYTNSEEPRVCIY